ncbi:MAG: aminotransferase class V-fold PLP-dependent enzyme, partial [Candidatus Altiarchaeales archaeon]|nr:aminotransferase class V-fold PLP-dependent enzyme [Candidatus Altiarchaeales archaeon]
MEPVYLDNASTTRLAPDVFEAMKLYLTDEYANASSIHAMGQKAKTALEDSRAKIAKYLGAQPSEIIFTSGGTESNNHALKGVLWGSNKKHLITTRIEHDSIMRSAAWLE